MFPAVQTPRPPRPLLPSLVGDGAGLGATLCGFSNRFPFFTRSRLLSIDFAETHSHQAKPGHLEGEGVLPRAAMDVGLVTRHTGKLRRLCCA